MSTAAMLVLALLLDAAVGEPRWLWSRLPHPAVLLGRAVAWLDRTLNRGEPRRLKGVLALLILGVGALALGWLLSLAGPLIEILAAAILLAQRSLAQHVAAVADALRLSTAEGRRAVAMIVSRDTAAMDGPQVARAALESGAENLSDGVVAPAFWFLIGGLPGMLLYKAVNTADSMIGYCTPRHKRFGWASARMDDLLNLVPARLTCLLIALPSRLTDWRGILTDARRHRSPNAGWPEAALSRALGVSLAGPRSYDGVMRDLPWVNPADRHDTGPDDIDAGVALLWRSWRLALLFCALVASTRLLF